MRTETEEYIPEDIFDQNSEGESPFPNCKESEIGVLGCILQNSEVLDQAIEYGVNPNWFYDLKHQELYTVMLSMIGDNKTIDLITLNNELKTTGKMTAVGGLVYVANLQDQVPSSSHLEYYLGILKEKHVARLAMAACKDAYDSMLKGKNPMEIVSKLERSIMGIGEGTVTNNIRGMKELMRSAMTRIEKRVKGELVGLKTGFRDFDRNSGGLYPGDLVVLGGRPGCGKTTLSMGIAENVANQLKESGQAGSVVMFSLEMDADSLTDRLVMSNSGVDVRRITQSTHAEDQRKVVIALGRLAKLDGRLIIDDTPGLTVSKLASKARHYRRRNNCQLIILDYLQLMSGDKAEKSRQEEISRVSVAMKVLAKELKIPIVALCQLNREIEKEKNRKPRKSDIRDSGQIEQDADFIGILYNPAKSTDDVEVGEPHQINLRVCKARNGMSDIDIPFTFIPKEVRFSDFQRGVE
jgi:replicative DNA helicase